MATPGFRNGERITAGHIRIGLQIMGGLITILISLIVYIYLDHVYRTDKLYQELIQITEQNTCEVAAIKKYILLKDGVDIDAVIDQHEWERLHEQFKSNPRGVYLQSIIPDEEIAGMK